MDINCGEMVEGVSLEAKRREMFDTLLRVASGERSTRRSYGRRRVRLSCSTVKAAR